MEEPRSPRREPRRGRWISLAIVGIILLIVALWVYVGPSKTGQKMDFVQAVGILLAGLVGLGGLFFTWRNQGLTQGSLEDTQRTTREQLRLTEQGQITERFTRAIDQLGATDNDGNPRLEVRLGGIYALERIDKEAPERAYHSTVMEVLTAYIRENARWRPPIEIPRWRPNPTEPPKSPDENSVSDSAFTEAAEQDVESHLQSSRSDIRAILDILNRREEDQVPEKHRVDLDLRGADLQRAYLKEFDLRGALLFETHFEGANLERAKLQGAQLERANFQRASLKNRQRRPTNLKGAQLQRAQLQGAQLQGAQLQGAQLQGAQLQGAQLQGAQLKDANLVGASLVGADLDKAKDLTPDQIQWTIGNDGTTLPKDFVNDDRPLTWRKSTTEQIEVIAELLKQNPNDE